MTICKACGASVSEKRVFCGNCGEAQIVPQAPPANSLTSGAQAQPGATPASYAEAPSVAYPGPLSSMDQAPLDYSPYALVSAWKFFGTMVLFNIPIIGWVFTIVWACGGVYNQTLVRFARAQLLCWAAVGLCIAGIFLLTGVPLANIIKLIINP